MLNMQKTPLERTFLFFVSFNFCKYLGVNAWRHFTGVGLLCSFLKLMSWNWENIVLKRLGIINNWILIMNSQLRCIHCMHWFLFLGKCILGNKEGEGVARFSFPLKKVVTSPYWASLWCHLNVTQTMEFGNLYSVMVLNICSLEADLVVLSAVLLEALGHKPCLI